MKHKCHEFVSYAARRTFDSTVFSSCNYFRTPPMCSIIMLTTYNTYTHTPQNGSICRQSERTHYLHSSFRNHSVCARGARVCVCVKDSAFICSNIYPPARWRVWQGRVRGAARGSETVERAPSSPSSTSSSPTNVLQPASTTPTPMTPRINWISLFDRINFRIPTEIGLLCMAAPR